MSVVVSHGVPALAKSLKDADQHVQEASAWALGQIGRHSPEHAKFVAEANVFPTLLRLSMDLTASEDRRAKVSVFVCLCVLCVLCVCREEETWAIAFDIHKIYSTLIH